MFSKNKLEQFQPFYNNLAFGTSLEELQASPGQSDAIRVAQRLRNKQSAQSLPFALLFVCIFFITHVQFTNKVLCSVWFGITVLVIGVRYMVSKTILGAECTVSDTKLLENENKLFISGLVVQIMAGLGFWMVIPEEGSEIVIFSYATMCAVYALGSGGTFVRCNYLPLYILANLGPGVIYMVLTQHYSSGIMFAYLAFMMIRSGSHIRMYIDRADAASLQLAETNNALKVAVKEKKYLVDSASHDLGQGINGINLLTSNLRYIENKEDRETCITDILTSVEQLNEEVLSLGYSAYSEAVEKTDPEPCGISHMAHSTVNSLKISAKTRSLNIKAIADRDVLCFANRKLLHSTINNLVQNAVKYTDSGSVSVKVLADDKRQEVTFSITDTGIGIPDELIKDVFEEGYQVSPDTVGAGVGLYTVRKNLESMGADWSIQSALGVGTTITFTLPMADPDGRKGVVERLDVQIEGARILVVDDSEISRNSLVGVFLDLGCEVTGVSTAAEARNLNGGNYDYCIIDYMLDDDQNGCDVARSLNLPSDQLSIVTATSDENALEEIQSMFDLKRKPMNPARLNELLSRVERFVKKVNRRDY